MAASRAGIYVRISVDRDGSSESPGRQVADCRAAAERRQLEVVGVYEDRDTSAYSRTAKRPSYERLLDDCRAGRVDVIVFWKLDRLTRQGLRGLAELLELGVKLVSATEEIDTTTAMGEGVAGILASVAKQESQNTSVRVARARRAAAESGKMSTGGPRPYGFTRAGEIVPAEAEVIREAARRVLAGESGRSVAADLNARGVPTSTGTDWHGSTLLSMLRNPTRAGFVVHRGEIIGEAPERAIISPAVWQQLVDAKAEPRAYRKPYHLLAGIAYCSLCGGKLKTMGFRQRNGKTFERYQCVKSPGRPNCGKVAITKRGLDAYVKAELFRALTLGHLTPARAESGPDEAELRRLLEQDEQSLADLARLRFVDNVIETEAEYLAALVPLRERVVRTTEQLEVLADEQRRVEQTRGLTPGSPEQLEEWWDAASDTERRDAVHAAVPRVEVRPAKRRGGNVLDTSRIVVFLDIGVLLKIADQADPEAPAPPPDPALVLETDADNIAQRIIEQSPELERRRDEIARQVIEGATR